MTQKGNEQHQKPGLGAPGQTPPSHTEEANKQKQEAEQKEVAGRHKNDGQKDHKGAR